MADAQMLLTTTHVIAAFVALTGAIVFLFGLFHQNAKDTAQRLKSTEDKLIVQAGEFGQQKEMLRECERDREELHKKCDRFADAIRKMQKSG